MLTKRTGLGIILALSLLSGNAVASDYNSQPPQPQQWQQGQQQNPGQGNGSSRVPPDSAISACSGKSEGTACTVTGPNGTKQGVCAYTPDRKYYACKPNDMNMQSQPPQR